MATDPVMKIVPPFTPELLPEVSGCIEKFLASCHGAYVLELGSGWSTVWFARMGVYLVSLEDHPDWYAEVLRVTEEEGLMTCCLLEKDFPGRVASFQDGIFDLVYVDCVDEQRIPCLQASIPKLKPDGWLVLDDSHWDMLQPAFEILKDWRQFTMDGYHRRKTSEIHYHRTTVFHRSQA